MTQIMMDLVFERHWPNNPWPEFLLLAAEDE